MLKNKSKLISSIALSVIALSVFYYLVVFLPNKSKRDMEFRETQKLAQEEARCMSSASDYARKLEGDSAYGVVISVKRYKYNPAEEVLAITKTNSNTSCFIEYDVFFGGTITDIVNVYTKEFIATTSRDKNGVVLVPAQETSYNSIKVMIFGY